jgi:hypothetical protein
MRYVESNKDWLRSLEDENNLLTKANDGYYRIITDIEDENNYIYGIAKYSYDDETENVNGTVYKIYPIVTKTIGSDIGSIITIAYENPIDNTGALKWLTPSGGNYSILFENISNSIITTNDNGTKTIPYSIAFSGKTGNYKLENLTLSGSGWTYEQNEVINVGDFFSFDFKAKLAIKGPATLLDLSITDVYLKDKNNDGRGKVDIFNIKINNEKTIPLIIDRQSSGELSTINFYVSLSTTQHIYNYKNDSNSFGNTIYLEVDEKNYDFVEENKNALKFRFYNLGSIGTYQLVIGGGSRFKPLDIELSLANFTEIDGSNGRKKYKYESLRYSLKKEVFENGSNTSAALYTSFNNKENYKVVLAPDMNIITFKEVNNQSDVNPEPSPDDNIPDINNNL